MVSAALGFGRWTLGGRRRTADVELRDVACGAAAGGLADDWLEGGARDRKSVRGEPGGDS